jgi:MoxR-like ATPase
MSQQHGYGGGGGGSNDNGPGASAGHGVPGVGPGQASPYGPQAYAPQPHAPQTYAPEAGQAPQHPQAPQAYAPHPQAPPAPQHPQAYAPPQHPQAPPAPQHPQAYAPQQHAHAPAQPPAPAPPAPPAPTGAALQGPEATHISRCVEQFRRVHQNIRQVILGKDEVIERMLWAIAASGHILFRDVPGVGKTMLAKTFAASVSGTFRRVQFTPDVLPMDITGANIFNVRTKAFEFVRGPVFTNVLLADEINRAPPKTQAALLEVMEERQVTVEGATHKIDPPFVTLATMNPLDDEGTYALPAAQMDRFMMMLSVGYPPPLAEAQMLEVHLAPNPILADVAPVVSMDDVRDWQATAKRVYVAPEVRTYIVSLMGAIRQDSRNLRSLSPRSALMLARACQARALFSGRSFVHIDDVKVLAPDVLGHRIMTGDSSVGRELVQQWLARVPAPA